MMQKAIEVNNVSKKYRLGVFGTGSLKDDTRKLWAKLLGKGDPFQQVGDENDRSKIGGADYVWALKNINFSVEKGEVIGIIGKNGAGKSTLLKILSNIAPPTTGSIKMNGRVASLLEVGTGFHPELTGRENIFLNGAVLGMNKAEISSKLQEIIEFSGVAKYIDTPVKRYSSGMKVRLGFAVAAHLEPEILIVDEVLAVGDAEFQKKAIGKMQDVADGQGRTVLFVSHNMSSVRSLCNRSILLKNGTVQSIGPTNDIITEYLQEGGTKTELADTKFEHSHSSTVALKRLKIVQNGQVSKLLDYTTSWSVEVSLDLHTEISDLFLFFYCEDMKGNWVFASGSDDASFKPFANAQSGKHQFKINVPGAILKPGDYFLTITAREKDNMASKDEKLRFTKVTVVDTRTYRGENNLYRPTAVVAPIISWSKTGKA